MEEKITPGVEFGIFMRKAIEDAVADCMKWKGTWRAGGEYKANDVVQDKGSNWIAVAPKPDGRPGSGCGWRLMAKDQAK